MTINEQRKKYYISVKKLTAVWEAGGMKSLGILLNDPNSIIEKDSWVEKIKKLYNEKKYFSVDAEIGLITNVFKYNHNDETKERNSGRDKHRRASNKDKGDSVFGDEGKTHHAGDPLNRFDAKYDGQSIHNRTERGASSLLTGRHGRDEIQKMVAKSWWDTIKGFFIVDKKKI